MRTTRMIARAITARLEREDLLRDLDVIPALMCAALALGWLLAY